jgi:hypothetical protein
MFKFLILIYLFSVSSYSQPDEQQQEQQEIEYEDELGEDVAEGSGDANRTGVTVASCGRNNVGERSNDKIVGGRGMK